MYAALQNWWTGTTRVAGSSGILVLLLRGLIWKAARKVWSVVIRPFVHFNSAYLRLNDFRSWPQFDPQPVANCTPASGQQCPLPVSPADNRRH